MLAITVLSAHLFAGPVVSSDFNPPYREFDIANGEQLVCEILLSTVSAYESPCSSRMYLIALSNCPNALFVQITLTILLTWLEPLFELILHLFFLLFRLINV